MARHSIQDFKVGDTISQNINTCSGHTSHFQSGDLLVITDIKYGMVVIDKKCSSNCHTCRSGWAPECFKPDQAIDPSKAKSLPNLDELKAFLSNI